MAAPVRVTGPLLDVLEILLRAWQDDEELHGWTIMKRAKRSGPTVYGVLDRLEDARWVAGAWEEQHPQPGRPRRRFYRLTPSGRVDAAALVASRRPVPAVGRRRPEPGWTVLDRVRDAVFGGAR